MEETVIWEQHTVTLHRVSFFFCILPQMLSLLTSVESWSRYLSVPCVCLVIFAPIHFLSLLSPLHYHYQKWAQCVHSCWKIRQNRAAFLPHHLLWHSLLFRAQITIYNYSFFGFIVFCPGCSHTTRAKYLVGLIFKQIIYMFSST